MNIVVFIGKNKINKFQFKINYTEILKLERLRICRDRDELLDNQSLRYEERLVELHSVIAELSRQLEQKARERIAEEEDDIDAENDADTSCENNSDICQTNSGRTCNLQNTTKNTVENNVSKSDILSRTSTDVIDAEAVEVILLYSQLCKSCSINADL